MVQKILQNKYLKSIFENLKIQDFWPTFLNFHKGKSILKIDLFLEVKTYISREPVMLER